MKKTLALGLALMTTVNAVDCKTIAYCLDCGIHQELVGTHCQCKKGYILFQNQCSRCPELSRYNCRLNVCSCNQGYTYNAINNICNKDAPVVIAPVNPVIPAKPIVQQPIVPVVQQPVYVAPQPVVQPIVVQPVYVAPKPIVTQPIYVAPQPVTPVYVAPIATGKCGLHEIQVPGGTCDCDFYNGYARLDGINCLKCPQRSYWDAPNLTCKCEWGLELKAGACVAIKY